MEQQNNGLITVEKLRDYFGVDESCDDQVEYARAAAIEKLNRATQTNWTEKKQVATANEVIQAMAYLNFFGIRGEVKNTEFLENYIAELVCSLQLTKEIVENGAG